MSKGDRRTEELVFGVLQHTCGLMGDFVHNRGTESGEGDSKPDFIGNHDGAILGIEITYIHVPEKPEGMPLQQHEAEKDDIVEEACEKAVQFGLPPLTVEIIFAGNPPKKKYRKTNWADTLFEIVRSHCPEPGGVTVLGGMEGDDLPEGFYWIGMNRIFKWKKHSWSCQDEAGDVETDFRAQLQDIINTKASKFRRYLRHCDKCWLVIAAPGRRPSSFYRFTDEMTTTAYTSSFERVYFMDVAGGTVHRLSIIEGV